MDPVCSSIWTDLTLNCLLIELNQLLQHLTLDLQYCWWTIKNKAQGTGYGQGQDVQWHEIKK